MITEAIPVKDVDDYISRAPKNIRVLLEKIRQIIKKSAPKAEEVLSYYMPAYKYNGMLLYFAAHTNHIGFYPFTSAIARFKHELLKYHTSKGTIQFPNDKPIPFGLISKIVKFRVKENEAKKKAKK